MFNIRKKIEELGLKEEGVAPQVYWSVVPPWLMSIPEIDLSIMDNIKHHEGTEYPNMVKRRLENQWGTYLQIYTDGSQDPQTGKSGFAFYIPQYEYVKLKRLSEGVSVYTTELLAIIWALKWIEEVQPRRAVICSDSASVLKTLGGSNMGARPDLFMELMVLLYKIEKAGGSVGFLRVPAHVGVEGNEVADKVAKMTLKRDIDLAVCIGVTECRSVIKENTIVVWQRQWEKETKGRHYYAIQNKVKTEQSCLGKSRRQAVIMTRLRLGHCGFAWDLAKIGKHEDGLCRTCNQQQTVNHVFMECQQYKRQREQLYSEVSGDGQQAVTLRDILNPHENQSRIVEAVMDFISATGLAL